jgi:hypothetical protein
MPNEILHGALCIISNTRHLINNKYLLFLFIPTLLLSCNSTEVKNLSNETVEYSDLPQEVKNVVFEPYYSDPNDSDRSTFFIDLNNPPRYTEVSKQSFLPWIYNSELHRIDDGKIFKLNFSDKYGYKIVVLEDFLYIPQHSSIWKHDSSSYTFSKFSLKK